MFIPSKCQFSANCFLASALFVHFILQYRHSTEEIFVQLTYFLSVYFFVLSIFFLYFDDFHAIFFTIPSFWCLFIGFHVYIFPTDDFVFQLLLVSFQRIFFCMSVMYQVLLVLSFYYLERGQRWLRTLVPST